MRPRPPAVGAAIRSTIASADSAANSIVNCGIAIRWPMRPPMRAADESEPIYRDARRREHGLSVRRAQVKKRPRADARVLSRRTGHHGAERPNHWTRERLQKAASVFAICRQLRLNSDRGSHTQADRDRGTNHRTTTEYPP